MTNEVGWVKAIETTCPYCGAKANQRCRTRRRGSSGYTDNPVSQVHRSRISAASRAEAEKEDKVEGEDAGQEIRTLRVPESHAGEV